ncbi:unnamed protein product [Ectocarpus sp. CCAP 1310/34]|nr:unnamed protein product [Ectocarpus sp. CCAP 1310/34]
MPSSKPSVIVSAHRAASVNQVDKIKVGLALYHHHLLLHDRASAAIAADPAATAGATAAILAAAAMKSTGWRAAQFRHIWPY